MIGSLNHDNTALPTCVQTETVTGVDVLGLDVVDRFEHLSKASRAQPGGRRQVHARRNLSTLFVLRKPRRAAT